MYIYIYLNALLFIAGCNTKKYIPSTIYDAPHSKIFYKTGNISSSLIRYIFPRKNVRRYNLPKTFILFKIMVVYDDDDDS